MKTMNTSSITTSRRIPRISLGTTWLLVWLGIAAWFGFGREWLRHNPSPAQAAFSPRPSALSSPQKLEAVAISKMRVGDQVPAENPTGERDTEFGDTVDPPSWRKLVLLASKKDGSLADIELIRPLWWLEEQAAQVGGSIEINVPECGIEGIAQVLAIESCPAIKHDRQFRIVTGTFKHQASQVIEVYIGDLDEPIGTTPNHPFWSEDRERFVRADQLREGERLRAFNGTPIVRRVIPLPDPEPVFNLEVQCDHVYHVAKNGVLVHNSTPCPILLGETMADRVRPAAAAVGARTFSPRSLNPDRWMPNQIRWIDDQIASGRRIFDIGTDARRAARSEYYAAEAQALRDAGYSRVFREWITAENGRRFRLYEWVLP